MLAIILPALLLSLSLSACGGGGDDRSAARNPELIAVARAGDADRVRSLLKRGAAVHGRDATAPPLTSPTGEGVTPLAHARRQGFDEMAAMLERAGGRA